MSTFVDAIAEKLATLSSDSIHSKNSTVFFLTSENNKYKLAEGLVIQTKGNNLQIKNFDTSKVAHAISEKGTYFWISKNKVAYSLKGAESLFKKELGIVEPIQKKSSYLTAAKKVAWWNTYDKADFSKISNRDVNTKVTAFLQDFLDSFEIHGRYNLKFDRVRNASNDDTTGYITKGDVCVDIDITSISGVKVAANVIVPIRNGSLIEPSILFYNGTSKIIAQSAFDEITNNNTFMKNPVRNMEDVVSPKLLEYYQNTKYPIVQFGQFAI